MKFLSFADIASKAPAAYAVGAAEGLSERYAFINTRRLIDQLADYDWFPVAAYQGRSRDVLHATHQIVFRKLHPLESLQVGDLIPQLILIGDHRGRKAAEILAGFERLACLNGLTIATGLAEDYLRQVHKGEGALNIAEALLRARTALDGAILEIADWKQLDVNPLERARFAYDALALRCRVLNQHPGFSYPLLTRNRAQDEGDDLWTVFNVVQENLLRGGVAGVSGNRKLRGIKSITPFQRINQALWGLAQRFARKLKGE